MDYFSIRKWYTFQLEYTDEHLIHYYTDQMNFMVPTDLATAKPIYDFSCKFMCQEVKDLAMGQEDFFNHFLPDEA